MQYILPSKELKAETEELQIEKQTSKEIWSFIFQVKKILKNREYMCSIRGLLHWT
jgi:hypothetical protein